MVMDSIVTCERTGASGGAYVPQVLAGADDRFFIPVAGALVARFPTPGYVERVIHRNLFSNVGRVRIRLGTTQPQTVPHSQRYGLDGGIPLTNGSNPPLGIPVPKDEVLAVDVDNPTPAQDKESHTVILLRRGAPGISPRANYERVTAQNATLTLSATVANTWSAATALVFESILEQNKLYHLLGAFIQDGVQAQEHIVAARFRQIETAIGGTLDPRPTIMGGQTKHSATLERFPEVIAFPGSAPPSVEIVDSEALANVTYGLTLLIGEVGPLTTGQMQQQGQRAQAPSAVPWG